jgi:hypothetical protein
MPARHELQYYLPCSNCGLLGKKHVDDKCLFEPTSWHAGIDDNSILRTRELLHDEHYEKGDNQLFDDLLRDLQKICPHRQVETLISGGQFCRLCAARWG